MRRLLAWGAAIALLPSPGLAQLSPAHGPAHELVPGDTVLAAPAQSYPAGAFHRFLLGDGWRELWDVPVPVPVLDLDAWAGGLTLVGEGGGNQTRSLRFTSPDGRTWHFRSVDKNAARTLDPELRRSVAASILQDQISSLFPLSAMVVAPLVEAVGVLHPDPELRVMPADPRLGELGDEFAGMLGWIEERPDEGPDDEAGFAESDRVVGSERLFERLEDDPDTRVEARALLRARLVDVLVGDWDRHPGQWRWARFEEDGLEVFHPVPRDRDWSLARIDGAFTWLSWVPWPQYMGFGPELGSPFRRTWNGQALDRRLLVGLSREAWEEETRTAVTALSDSVLAAAVARLPQAYRERVGPTLEAELRARRDALPAFSRAWYEHLAGWVDVHTTDRPELARITRLGTDTLRVEVFELEEGVPAPEPHYRRDFTSAETREVRLDLHGDDDRVVVEGAPRGRVVVRVVGGGSDDVFVDRTSGEGIFFYDHQGDNVFEPAAATTVDESEWGEPYDPADRTDQVPARDWGARTLPRMELSYSPDWGVSAGAGARRTEFGFRHWPYRSRLTVEGGMVFRTTRLQGAALWDAALGPDTRLHLGLEARGAEVRRFYGFGNDTDDPGGDDAFRAERREIRLSGRLSRELGQGGRAGVGLTWRGLRDLGNPGTLVDSVRPYGFPDFQQVGLGADLSWEGREPATLLEESWRLEMRAGWFPALLDVEDSFVTLDATATASLPLSPAEAEMPPVLAVRAGGRKAWGGYPYHEAALLGGRDDLRGYRNQRFSGHTSLYLNTELRVGVGRFFFLLPGDVGVFALADAGRVFHPADVSGAWHTAVGGGVWVSFLQAYSATLAVARGEITGLYASLGFPF